MGTAVIARQKGDSYQARFWWQRAMEMLVNPNIRSVIIEWSEVRYVDDVIVRYVEPQREFSTGTDVVLECFQCKFHMTLAGAFTAEALCDPEFIRAKTSLLQRIADAHKALSATSTPFRIIIVSNHAWHQADPMVAYLHDERIRDDFFVADAPLPVRALRDGWCSHLGIDLVQLRALLGVVRFRLGLALSELTRGVVQSMRQAGFAQLDHRHGHFPYDGVIWDWFGQGHGEYSREWLMERLRSERLISGVERPAAGLLLRTMIAARALVLSEPQVTLDASGLFEGRYPRDAGTWPMVRERIVECLVAPTFRDLPRPVHVHFESHLTAAFLLGRLADTKAGLHLVPTQFDARHGRHEPWLPGDVQDPTAPWEFSVSGEWGSQAILAISVTTDVSRQVRDCQASLRLQNCSLIEVRPRGGPSRTAVSNGTMAWVLGRSLRQLLEQRMPLSVRHLHLFIASPVASAFIFGDTLRSIVPAMSLYEYDFEGTRHPDCRYQLSYSDSHPSASTA